MINHAKSDMNIYNRLKSKWLELGIPFNEGISHASIEHFEKRHGLTLPSTFKEYLRAVNGMKYRQTDENLVSFLSLDAIDQEAVRKVSGDEVDIIFAEFCVFSHYYLLRLKRSGEQVTIAASDGAHEKRIADSFEGFLSQYLIDPSKVAYCWS